MFSVRGWSRSGRSHRGHSVARQGAVRLAQGFDKLSPILRQAQDEQGLGFDTPAETVNPAECD